MEVFGVRNCILRDTIDFLLYWIPRGTEVSLRFSCLHSKLGSDAWSNLEFAELQVHGDLLSFLLNTEWYLYASARCNQSSGESLLLIIDSPLCQICDPVQLVPIRFGRVGHYEVATTVDTTVGCGRCLWDSEVCVRDWAPTCKAFPSHS